MEEQEYVLSARLLLARATILAFSIPAILRKSIQQAIAGPVPSPAAAVAGRRENHSLCISDHKSVSAGRNP
jgi:hypothetical protein